MSEIIDNNKHRKELLKQMILQLHEGKAADHVRKQLMRLMGKVPYNLVVEAEQELISEGLPAYEVLKLCDIHGEALKGVVDLSTAQEAPPGHPVHTFQMENRALEVELDALRILFHQIEAAEDDADVSSLWMEIHHHFNNLMDVDKHYRRKENLLFPYLEKYEITGPPTVMWGKDDEIRELLKASLEALSATQQITAGEAKTVLELVLKPAAEGVDEMIYKEEEILFPMCLDTLTPEEWYEIYRQSDEIGYCLYDPQEVWVPSEVKIQPAKQESRADGRIQLPTGSFTVEELNALFNTLPVDITFVDKNDQVRYFNNSEERIFDRNRAILGRAVQMCHPPQSVHVVQRILDDFRSGRQNRAEFWIQFQGKFVHITYYAVRNEKGEYLGTLEVTQDISRLKQLQGEKRLLSYEETTEETSHGK